MARIRTSASPSTDESAAPPRMTQEQRLRALGQALENLHIDDFDLRVVGDDYIGRAFAKAPRDANDGHTDLGSLARLWGLVCAQALTVLRKQQPASEFRYGPEDLASLELVGQGRRANPGATSYGDRLSQLLRTIGHYLDRGGARLISATKRGSQVTIRYRPAKGAAVTEHF